ncbi:hypothetical protein [Parvibaculum sp.]|uniref:hypothetical protein n=1 Tax=Parvibaculum sp. TaxID=2024848 RepID=UPI002B9F8BCB|nr:hypothetical protein [Parvibaculum sp.]HUD52791.1 hypothetical protein [Parvibaculum sp.]
MPSALAMAYFMALVAGAVIACVFGRKSERVMMGLVFLEWGLTYPTWLWATSTGHGVPVLQYLCIDAFVALLMIEAFSRKAYSREWQLILIRLAILHVVVHMAFFLGVSFTNIPPTNRPYADLLTFLGYLEIFTVCRASINHEWRGRIDPEMARHPYRALLSGIIALHRGAHGSGPRPT